MSVVVDSFPTGTKQPSQYPFMDWVDGRIHKLTQGADFDCKPVSMAINTRLYYKRHGITARVSQRGSDVYIQRQALDFC